MAAAATTDSGWQLEGSAADAYEAYLVPAIFSAMSRRLVDVAGVKTGERILDVACGTGVVARAATQRVGGGGVVVGIDVNHDMLATAERSARGSSPSISWQRADARILPFDDGSFDVALCEEALQFIDDRVAVLGEMRRVTAPQGRVAASVLRSTEANPVYDIFARALGRHAGPEAEEMIRSPFALDAGELRSAATEAGLRDITVRYAVAEERFPSVEAFVHREAASSPLAAVLSALDDARLPALVAELEQDLAPHVDDLGLVFANETAMLTAHA